MAHVLDDAEHLHVDLSEHVSPLRTSTKAMSCGVETMTAPASDTCCAIVSCASPVSGGMSTIIAVELAPVDLYSICCKAPAAGCCESIRESFGPSSSSISSMRRVVAHTRTASPPIPEDKTG
jgi:hypothetical protein